MAESLEETLDIIRLQEEKCQFTRFNSEDALQLGLLLIENVKPYKKSVVIDITVNGHQLFHYAMNGTSKDNDEWVRRKKTCCILTFDYSNTVNRFGRSSYYVGRYVASQGKTFEEKYYASEKEYATHGGAFPLKIRNVGIIGTVTVSGLAQQDDHNVVANSIQEYIASQQSA